jgi:hypothetical protein
VHTLDNKVIKKNIRFKKKIWKNLKIKI